MEILPLDETTSLPPATPPAVNKKFRLLIGLVLGLLLLVGLSGVSAAVYLLPINDGFTRAVTNVLPYPAALVNLKPITFDFFYEEYDALQNFYEVNETPEAERLPAAETVATILDNMIDHAMVAQLAEQYHVKLDEAKLEENLQTAYAQNDSEEAFFAEINRMFGWDREDFLNHAMKPLTLSLQVEEQVWSDPMLQAEAKAKIDEALTRLKNNEDFSVVAGGVSEDELSAVNGGDIGHLTFEQIPEAWRSFVESAELNVPSDVLDLGQAYSLVMVTEKLTGEATQYNLKIIIINKKGLAEVKESFLAASKIWRFVEL